jgi:4-hydroxy-tetrahydrodipicolinate reductase
MLAGGTVDFTVVRSTADYRVQYASALTAGKTAIVVCTWDGTAGANAKVYVNGIDGAKREELARTVKNIPVVLSPNMSLSANVLFDMVETLARALPGYDAEIFEIHHNKKKDAPSGTAKRLAESVKKGRAAGEFVFGRSGLVGERTPQEIGVHALRGGDVVGDHTVFFIGNGERIELAHRVTSRNAFAAGALVAAKWLARQPAGLYDMRDVLGLKKN